MLPASPCATDFYETRHTRSTHRRNHVCQIFSRSVQGLRSFWYPKIAISHWLAASLLQLPCDTLSQLHLEMINTDNWYNQRISYRKPIALQCTSCPLTNSQTKIFARAGAWSTLIINFPLISPCKIWLLLVIHLCIHKSQHLFCGHWGSTPWSLAVCPCRRIEIKLCMYGDVGESSM